MIAMTVNTKLVLEIRDEANETPVAGIVALTPSISADYWSYRVQLSDAQAVLGFPKFSTVGIGFAVEDDSWNTNLPYHCPTDQILAHIIDNKGDDAISDADVREAIRMIQLAVIDERAAVRREFFNEVARVARNGSASVPGDLHDELLTQHQVAMWEHAMLRAEVDHLRVAPLPDSAPHGEPAPFDPTIPQVGVPADEAYRDHNGRVWVAHGGGAAGDRRLFLAGWEHGIVPVVDDMTHLHSAARNLPGGGHPFASLLLRVGVPTKDGRILSADGKFELPADAPILRVVDAEITYSPSDIVGRIVGLWRAGSDIYAVGVADPEVADALNLGELMLGADMDADVAAPPAQGEPLPTVITIGSGRVTAARVRAPEWFAWEI